MNEIVTQDQQQRIDANWNSVCHEVSEAAERSGRSASDITVVGVSKYVGASLTKALFDAGCEHLGESRPQKLWEKTEALADTPVQWHMIGHLQRNKVKRTISNLRCLHSIDSLRLAKAVDDAAREDGGCKKCQCLVEINVSGEQEKHGFHPDVIEAVLPELAAFENLSFTGLMCMAARGSDPEEARADFSALREIRDRLALSLPSGILMTDLSMGMSRDFVQAIEEGATLVRVGSRLFDGIERR